MIELKNDELIYVQKEGIEYIQFKRLLEYGVKHAYTLKMPNIDFGFNSKYHDESYKKLCDALGIDKDSVLEPHQKHTDLVKCISKLEDLDETENVDGLITDKNGIALTTKNADCILFVFYDPVKKVICNVHSGWRGTFKKISEKAVQKMLDNYGCSAEDILCFISPSIREDHFEVDADVKELCEEIFRFTGKLNEFIKVGQVIDNIQKYNIDTVLINKILLENLGLKSENIIDSNLCSVCNGEYIESVRVDGENSGRATFIVSL